MTKSELEELFESTEGKDFYKRLNDLEKSLNRAKNLYRREYDEGMELAKEELGTENLGRLQRRYDELFKIMNKKINNDENIQKILSDIQNLKAEKELAKKEFVRVAKSQDYWKNLVGRQITPKILEQLEKNTQGMTELQLVDVLKGKLEDNQNPYSQFCYPLFYMDKLGWINRMGSGTVGDQKVNTLTNLGKKQLESFRKVAKFDKSLQ